MESNSQPTAIETSGRAESLDAVQAALRAADEIAAAVQAHLTQEHGTRVEDRAHAVAPTLDLLRHARAHRRGGCGRPRSRDRVAAAKRGRRCGHQTDQEC